jgi:CelD/BcsL family acetyltransferase involved in cellulose biosynthesis
MIDYNNFEQLSLNWELLRLVDILPKWRKQQDNLYGSMAQTLSWVSNWQTHVNPDCFCIIANNCETIEFILTLEVIKGKLLTIAAFPGETHANENFPAITSTFKGDVDKNLDIITSLIKTHRPDIDAIYLERQIEILDNGFTNPILSISKSVPTDIALSFKLEPDFLNLIATRGKQNKQKKMRRMARQLDGMGEWSYDRTQDIQSTCDGLAEFYNLKTKRLNQKGLKDVFSSPKIQTFLNALCIQSLEQKKNMFEINTLKINNKIVAVEGNCILRDQLSSCFIAVDDSQPNISYGVFMNFETVSRSCARGLKTFSNGTGDEPYKRSWADIETPQYNMSLSLSTKGSIAAFFRNLKTKIFKKIKSHHKLYEYIKKIRKFVKR